MKIKSIKDLHKVMIGLSDNKKAMRSGLASDSHLTVLCAQALVEELWLAGIKRSSNEEIKEFARQLEHLNKTGTWDFDASDSK